MASGATQEQSARAGWKLLYDDLVENDPPTIRTYLQQQRALGRADFLAMVEAKARMAIVTDIDWMTSAIKLFRLLSPGELRHVDSDDYDQAKEWICESDRARINSELDADAGILILDPAADKSLSEDEFEAVGKTVSTYLESHDRLPGILIHGRRFPGWHSIGALFSHLKFVNVVHDKISKVALVTNSPMGSFADRVIVPLILAKVRKFDYDQRDEG